MSETRASRQKDQRSTAELIEAALAECQREDAPERMNIALVILEERGTRDVLEAAIESCHSPEPSRRKLGAEILGQLGSGDRTFPEECCDALLDLLKRDEDLGVLRSALFALGHLGNHRCDPDVIAFKNHPDDVVRHGVAFALVGATSQPSIEAQIEMMDDPYERVRDWATTSIGGTVSIDGPAIRDALLNRADDDDPFTRAEALHGLARRHDERVLPLLIANLSAGSDFTHLFADAAQSYLGLDEETEMSWETMLAMLKAQSERL